MVKIHTSCLIMALLVWLTAADAFAMLHPQQGRFMQRDPLGYVDGMSVYQYLRGQPTGPNRDPRGTQAATTQAATRPCCCVCEDLQIEPFQFSTKYFDKLSEEKGVKYFGGNWPIKYNAKGKGDFTKCRFSRKVLQKVTIKGQPDKDRDGTVLDGTHIQEDPLNPQAGKGTQKGDSWAFTDLDAPGFGVTQKFLPASKVSRWEFTVENDGGTVTPACRKTTEIYKIDIEKDGKISHDP